MTADPRIEQIRAEIANQAQLGVPSARGVLQRIRRILDREPLPDGETERPRRCPALTPAGDLITEGRQCQQYEGHPHDHTWYGDNGHAYSAWTEVQP